MVRATAEGGRELGSQGWNQGLCSIDSECTPPTNGRGCFRADHKKTPCYPSLRLTPSNLFGLLHPVILDVPDAGESLLGSDRRDIPVPSRASF